MKRKTQYRATQAQHFANGYPREMFGGKCSNDLFSVGEQPIKKTEPPRAGAERPKRCSPTEKRT